MDEAMQGSAAAMMVPAEQQGKENIEPAANTRLGAPKRAAGTECSAGGESDSETEEQTAVAVVAAKTSTSTSGSKGVRRPVKRRRVSDSLGLVDLFHIPHQTKVQQAREAALNSFLGQSLSGSLDGARTTAPRWINDAPVATLPPTQRHATAAQRARQEAAAAFTGSLDEAFLPPKQSPILADVAAAAAAETASAPQHKMTRLELAKAEAAAAFANSNLGEDVSHVKKQQQQSNESKPDNAPAPRRKTRLARAQEEAAIAFDGALGQVLEKPRAVMPTADAEAAAAPSHKKSRLQLAREEAAAAFAGSSLGDVMASSIRILARHDDLNPEEDDDVDETLQQAN